jgi:hypothetical protein
VERSFGRCVALTEWAMEVSLGGDYFTYLLGLTVCNSVSVVTREGMYVSVCGMARPHCNIVLLYVIFFFKFSW